MIGDSSDSQAGPSAQRIVCYYVYRFSHRVVALRLVGTHSANAVMFVCAERGALKAYGVGACRGITERSM